MEWSPSGSLGKIVLHTSQEGRVETLMEVSRRPKPYGAIRGGTIAYTHAHRMPSWCKKSCKRTGTHTCACTCV